MFSLNRRKIERLCEETFKFPINFSLFLLVMLNMSGMASVHCSEEEIPLRQCPEVLLLHISVPFIRTYKFVCFFLTAIFKFPNILSFSFHYSLFLHILYFITLNFTHLKCKHYPMIFWRISTTSLLLSLALLAIFLLA